MGEEGDDFPVGMRVLAVDDNLTCLKILEAGLRICRYHVTTTGQAIEALRMLRENRDKFDLIITDVHMPDMDGYKLLELVGLEMDLPVIMLSADSDPKAVMKGITHGACDYLLKPVRIEELKNIWQHVIRKKNSVGREHSHSDNATSESSGHKVGRKRKDQNDDEEDEEEENMNKAENVSQKKPRTVWTQELHQKFVTAFFHFGDKAVPKRILEHMTVEGNVEGLTRENVASHLQKYRLYLKKLAIQNASLASVLGVRDSLLPLAAVDSFGDFHSFTSSSQAPAFSCSSQNGSHIRKLPNVLGHDNISYGLTQVAHTHNVHNHVNDLGNFQHGNLIQRMPATLEFNQLQQHKRMMHQPNNPFVNPLTLHAHQTSNGLSSMCSGSYEMNDEVASNNTWGSSVPSSSSVTPVVSQMNCNPVNGSSSHALVAPASHLMIGNMMPMVKGTSENSMFLNFGSARNTQQLWGAAKKDLTHEPNIAFGSFTNPPLASWSIVDSTSQSHRLSNVTYNNKIATNMNRQTDRSSMFLPEQCKIDKSIADGKLKSKDEYFFENSTLQGGLSPTGHSFDDFCSFFKSECDGASFMDG